MQNCVTKRIKQKKSLFGDERIWLCVKSRRTRWWVAQCEVWCTNTYDLKSFSFDRSIKSIRVRHLYWPAVISHVCVLGVVATITPKIQFQQQFACVEYHPNRNRLNHFVSGGEKCLVCGAASANVTNLNASASSCCESFIYSNSKTRKKQKLCSWTDIVRVSRISVVVYCLSRVWRKTLVSSTVYVNRQCKLPHTASLFRSHYYYYFLFYNWTKSYEKAVKLERLPEYLRDTVDWFMG